MTVDFSHFAIEIDFQTSDHVVAMEKVAKQCISTKCSMCNSFEVTTNFTDYGRY